jgi:hypothetical protein
MSIETLEEAAKKEFPLIDTEWCRTGACEEENLHLLGHRKSFIKGAEWQQERMYSEEDMKQFGLYLGDNLKKLKGKSIDEIFEQFKNI